MIEIMSKSHIYKLKVFVEDIDFGRVYYSRYLQYIERAETELIHENLVLLFNLSTYERARYNVCRKNATLNI